MKMYELVGNYNQVWDMINNGEIDLQTIKDTLESIESAIEVKAENSVCLIKNLEAYAIGLESEINRLQAKFEAINNNVSSIKEYLFKQLELAKLTEIKTSISSIKQQNNKPSVLIENEKLIPAKYQTIIPKSYKINKNDIAKDLQAGKKVPGAKLQQNKSWRIR